MVTIPQDMLTGLDLLINLKTPLCKHSHPQISVEGCFPDFEEGEGMIQSFFANDIGCFNVAASRFEGGRQLLRNIGELRPIGLAEVGSGPKPRI